MTTKQRPYFLWDYNLTDEEVRAIIGGDDEEQKAWLVARLLESASYEDVWRYISLAELQKLFPKLKLKNQVRAAWEFAFQIWAADPHHER